MRTKRILFLTLVHLSFPVLGLASSYEKIGKEERDAFLSRIKRAKQQCLSEHFSPAPVNFIFPPKEEEKDYRPNTLQNILFPLQEEVYRIWYRSPKTERFFKTHLQNLGTSAKVFADETGLNPFQYGCVIGCVLNNLMEFDDGIKTPLLFQALAEGKGKCTHYSRAAEALFQSMGIEASMTNSLRHSFVTVRVWDNEFYFEPQQDGRVSCTYFSIPQ